MITHEVRPRVALQHLDNICAAAATRSYKRQSFECLELAAGDHFLDVGCGAGDDVLSAARIVGASGKATGVDANPTIIAEAWRRASGLSLPVHFSVETAVNLPFSDRCFSVSRSDRMFQHLARPEQAIAEMVRVTMSGGRVQVVDADWEALVIDSSKPEIGREIVGYMTVKAVQNGRIGRQLAGLFLRAGLRSLTVVPVARTFFDLNQFEQVVGVRRHAEAALQAGILKAEIVESWLADLEQRQAKGQFFAAALGFIVQGRKS
jgi:ubiquinone/menaquinone biosynthesis C-methylase UbiE